MFKRVIDDDDIALAPPSEVKRVAFCSGKLYYELAQARKAANVKDVALVRIEQVIHSARGAVVEASAPAIRNFHFYLGYRGIFLLFPQIAPFPYDVVAEVLRKYKNAEVVWAQEEPRNMGAWHYVAPRLVTSNKLAQVKPFTPKYIGRPASAAPSTGYKRVHDVEQAYLVKDVVNA